MGLVHAWEEGKMFYMFYKSFVTTFLILSIKTLVKAHPKWEDDNATPFRVLFCLVFMLAQSAGIAVIIMIIYNMWK